MAGKSPEIIHFEMANPSRSAAITDLGALIRKHLHDHHGPSVALELSGPAKVAVDAVNMADSTREISMPSGEILTALEIVERLHLEDFLEEEEWYP